jgi:diguanylate cyclase (GGDEF)-like protein/PAS domain S-box-containing protein
VFERFEKSALWQAVLCLGPAGFAVYLGGKNALVPALLLLGMGLFAAAHARWQRREREDMEMALLNRRRLEAKAWYFEGIVGGSANIIFTTDAEHRIMKFNEGSERAFGITQPEVLGKEVQGLFQDPEAVLDLLRQVEEKGAAEMPQIRAQNPEVHDPVWLSLSVTRMRNREGEIIGEVFNGTNITTRKGLEDELKRKNDQLLHLSVTDGLTGLYNIRFLHDELTRLCQTRRRFPDRAVSVALLDVDRFKGFNDTKGHPAGDALLAALARILKQEIRQGMDTAYRIGGDEFLLVLPDTREEGVQVICDRILQAYRKAGLEPTSLSVGIATDRDSPPADPDAAAKNLLARADKAMYRAKENGGDRAAVEEKG